MNASNLNVGTRRARSVRLLLVLLMVALGSLSGHDLARPAYAADNPIVIENQQPGSSGWLVTNPADDATGQIKGYASATSVQKGEPISFHVTVNPAQTYSIDVYRIGWYQGLGGRLMQHIGPLNGIQQPACPTDATTGLIACNWASSSTLSVPTTWTSGIYLALLTNAQSYQNYITFAVRDDNRSAPLLYQQSVTTYQAYNNYPDNNTSGKSLYEYNSYGGNTVAGTTRAVKVSFDRPYSSWFGAGSFLDWEIYFVRWLERSGYDVAYSTDLDTHANGSRLLNYKGFLSVGHDEYWSKQMRDAAEAARDAGVNLAFFGANAAYWQVRFEASANNMANRVMTCYKDASIDPVQGPTTTVQWRQAPANRPEQTLIGVQFTSQTLNNAYVPYVVTNSSHWIYANTGFNNGDTVAGIVGYEADHQWSTYPLPNYVAGSYTLLSQSPYTNYDGISDFANSSTYQAPSGAWVFGAGTIGWSWGLDNFGGHNIANTRLQQTTANILNRFINSGPQPGIAAPSNLSAIVASARAVNLTWTDKSINEDNFVIERSTDQVNWSILTSNLPANSSSYNDPIPSAGIYYYRVKATNAAGSSSNYSNTASANAVTVYATMQQILNQITTLRATVTSKSDSGKLDDAIKNLSDAISPSLWQADGNHLNSKDGDKVFKGAQGAADKLKQLINDKKSTIPSAALQPIVDRLVNADRVLSVVAINDAVRANGDPKQITKANDDLAKGDGKAAEGKPNDAIKSYGDAWKDVQKAIM